MKKFENFLRTLAMIMAASATAADLPRASQLEIENAKQGSLLVVPELARGRQQIPVIPVKITAAPGPPLLFSDMPEYLEQGNGVALMEDVSAGNCRLYIYHVPGTKTVRKTISVVIQNSGREPLRVQFDHYAFPKPGTDYAAMGVGSLIEFFTGKTLPSPLTIPEGGQQVLDPQLEATPASDPQLVHALYEFHLDQSARIYVLQRNTNESSIAVLDALPKLPRHFPDHDMSGAGRGIFPTADLIVTNIATIDTADGIQRLLLADGHADPWVKGIDSLSDKMAVTNKGNYGVFYHVRLSYKSSDGRGWALLLGKAYGASCPTAALRVSDGIWKGGWVGITGSNGTLRGRGVVAMVQKFAPPAVGTTNDIDLIYSPPGGSSLPTPIFLVPLKVP